MSAHPQALRPPSGSRRVKELAFRLGLYGCLGLALLMLAALLVDVAAGGTGSLSWDFITSFSSIDADRSGIQAAFWGTVWLMGVCALFIVPVGVATALYLEEYADRDRPWNRFVEVNIQNLAAVPSIVYGILGLAFFVRGFIALGQTVLAAALTLSLLVLPVVIIASREAIRSVPPSIRQGSLALGATKWQTICKQVLPGALAGIATGVILALSRAIGETAPLILVGATAFRLSDPTIDGPFSALPIAIFGAAGEPREEFQILAAGAIVVLLLVLLLMNSMAIYLRNRFEQKW